MKRRRRIKSIIYQSIGERESKEETTVNQSIHIPFTVYYLNKEVKAKRLTEREEVIIEAGVWAWDCVADVGRRWIGLHAA